MHIGLMIYGELDTVSGGYLYDRKLVGRLNRDGHQVELISLDWRSYLLHLTDNLSGSVYRRLKQFKGDLLIQDELNHPSLFWLNRRIKATADYPIFSIVHHLRSQEPRPAWQNHFYRMIERRFLHTMDGFIFNSLTTLQTVHQLGINLDLLPHLVAFPAGDQFQPQISADAISKRAFEPGPLRLVFLGNLVPRKGLHILIDAAARLPLEDLTLTIIGDATYDRGYARRIQRQIQDSNQSGRVRLLGSLPPERLVEELTCHHVMVVPSFYEGYGIVYLEGMAFGLPAIATTAGAASEIISSDLNGFLVPPGDPAALARSITKLSHDRKKLAEMGLAARERYLSQPSWEQTTGSILEFLSSQMDKKHR